MKHIKNYMESFNKTPIKKRWLVSTKRPNLEISLVKIGYDDFDSPKVEEFAKKIRQDCRLSGNKKSVIQFEYYSDDFNFWDNTFLCRPEYKNMGEIIITPEEIEEWKIMKVAKKFNM